MRRLCMVVACALVACDGGSDEEAILDAVVISTDRVFAAIEETGSAWRFTVASGSEINGTLENGLGGSLRAVGFRAGAEHVAEAGFHSTFSEKLFLSFSNWPENGTILNGAVTVTRHSHDFGPPEGQIADASRMTSYQGSLATSGTIGGSFQLDVHAIASQKILWTCGTVNDAEMGHGACF
jgi:hypothetical protein